MKEREILPKHDRFPRLHGILERMRRMVDGGEQKRRGKCRFRLFARLFGALSSNAHTRGPKSAQIEISPRVL